MRTLAALTLLLSAFAVVSPSIALAQSELPTTEIVFRDPEAVSGSIDSADVENLVVLRPGVRHSLIRIRTQFVTELVASASNL